MPNRPETIDRLRESFEPLPVELRPMFGEHGIYCDDRMGDIDWLHDVAQTIAAIQSPKPRRKRG